MSQALRPRVLVLDDDAIWLEQVPIILEDEAEVLGLPTIDQGIQILQKESFDIILLDLNFVDDLRTGLDLFRRIHAIGCEADVIVISGETSPERLVEIFNAGVTRFIPKPALPDRVRQEIRNVLELRYCRSKAFSKGTVDSKNPFLGSSRAIQRVHEQVDLLVKRGARDILIQGETGTGKEVIARYIAKAFDRSGRFLPIHCGAIADGLVESELFGYVRGAFTGADRDRVGVFEAASGGVVFLDEIGEMPMHHQAKLLRVLQERQVQRVGTHTERSVSFRAIAATHVDLKKAVSGNRFREDLYFRIAHSVIQLPTLRERLEDIPLLVSVFLAGETPADRRSMTPAALDLLTCYQWPGNIRQLEAVVRNLKYQAEGDVIREKDVCAALPDVAARLPSAFRGPMGSYAYSLLQAERKKFEDALIKANGYRDEAAKLLGLSRATFYRRAKELGLIRTRLGSATRNTQHSISTPTN